MSGAISAAALILARLAVAAILVLLAGLAIVETPLQGADEELFRLVNGAGPAPHALQEALDPHTRNYALLFGVTVLLALITARGAVLRIATISLASALIGWGLLEALYALMHRNRPEDELGSAAVILDGRSWSGMPSYPSGHLAITAALCAVIALHFPGALWPVVAYLAAVGTTRVLFGAHFPGDVLGGAVLGIASAFAVTRLAALPWRRAPTGRAAS